MSLSLSLLMVRLAASRGRGVCAVRSANCLAQAQLFFACLDCLLPFLCINQDDLRLCEQVLSTVMIGCT